CLAEHRVGGKRHADVLEHRVLRAELEPLALAGALAPVERAEDRNRHQHAGAGVTERTAWLRRRPIALAGDAHDAAGRLRDHVEREVVLERAALSEPLDLR